MKTPPSADLTPQRRRRIAFALGFLVLTVVALVPSVWTLHELPKRAARSFQGSFTPMTPLVVHYTDKIRRVETEAKWVEKNGRLIDIRYYDDDACLALVQQYRPHFVESYRKNLSVVERADYFRYLAVWVYGGLYVDTDVEFTKPVDEWLDTFGWRKTTDDTGGATMLSTVDLVVGVEFPKPQTEYKATGWLPVQINQFLFAGTKGSGVMKRIIDYMEICITTIPRKDVEMTLERTGPAAFTRAVMNEIELRGLSDPALRSVVARNTYDKRHPPALLPIKELEKNGQLIAIAKDLDPVKQTTLVHPHEYILVLPYRAFGYNDAHGGLASGPVLAYHRNQNSWRKKTDGR